MAKEVKKSKAAKSKSSDKAETKEAKFGIDDFAKALGVEPATARIRCRDNKIKRSGRSYGWDSRDAMMKDVKKCQAAA